MKKSEQERSLVSPCSMKMKNTNALILGFSGTRVSFRSLESYGCLPDDERWPSGGSAKGDFNIVLFFFVTLSSRSGIVLKK